MHAALPRLSTHLHGMVLNSLSTRTTLQQPLPMSLVPFICQLIKRYSTKVHASTTQYKELFFDLYTLL